MLDQFPRFYIKPCVRRVLGRVNIVRTNGFGPVGQRALALRSFYLDRTVRRFPGPLGPALFQDGPAGCSPGGRDGGEKPEPWLAVVSWVGMSCLA